MERAYQIKLIQCNCGHIFIVQSPQTKAVWENYRKGIEADGLFTIVYAEGQTITCACGEAHELPAAEMLDADRTEFGRILMNWSGEDE